MEPNEQEDVLGVLWALLSRLEGNCKDEGDKTLVSNAYDLLNRIKFTDKRPRWEMEEKEDASFPPIKAHIYPKGGIDCEENCLFQSKCSNHESAGFIREKTGFSPELKMVEGKIICRTKIRKSDPNNRRRHDVPKNINKLSLGALTIDNISPKIT